MCHSQYCIDYTFLEFDKKPPRHNNLLLAKNSFRDILKFYMLKVEKYSSKN